MMLRGHALHYACCLRNAVNGSQCVIHALCDGIQDTCNQMIMHKCTNDTTVFDASQRMQQ